MKTYTTNHLVRHDGKDYAPGKPIKLEDDEAAPLIEAGALSAPKEDEKKPEKK